MFARKQYFKLIDVNAKIMNRNHEQLRVPQVRVLEFVDSCTRCGLQAEIRVRCRNTRFFKSFAFRRLKWRLDIFTTTRDELPIKVVAAPENEVFRIRFYGLSEGEYAYLKRRTCHS